MPYKILNADGTTLGFLADNVIDKSKTSLALVGKNVTSYGESLNNNLIKLLENFTNSTPPPSPQKGQLWYDTSNVSPTANDVPTLRIYTGLEFKPVSGVIVSSNQPALANGDLWLDPISGQTKAYHEGILYPIGPIFPKTPSLTYGGFTGSGWVPTEQPIIDTSGNEQRAIFLKSHGAFLGVATSTGFELDQQQSISYFNSTSTTTSIVSGLTIKGDISVTGRVTSKNLTMSVTLSELGSDGTYDDQNKKIMSLLEKMFIVTPNTSTSDLGVLYGSEARVLCRTASGYQVRRFKISNPLNLAVASWQPHNVYSSGTTNLVP
jgi:hypothetical protein